MAAKKNLKTSYLTTNFNKMINAIRRFIQYPVMPCIFMGIYLINDNNLNRHKTIIS